MICVHGRDRHSKGPKTRAADWDAIRRIKQALSIPVIANGSIGGPEDVQRCLDATGVDAVMSAEALCNPALFSCAGFGDVDVAASPISATRLALEYLDLVELYPVGDFLKIVKPHLFSMLYGLIVDEPKGKEGELTIIMERLQSARDVAACREVVNAAALVESGLDEKARRACLSSWYRRHRRKASKDSGRKGRTPQEERLARKALTRRWLEAGTRMN